MRPARQPGTTSSTRNARPITRPAQRVGAPPQADGCGAHGSDLLTLHRGTPIVQWCTRQLAGLGSALDRTGNARAKQANDDRRATHRRRDRYDHPQPVRILALAAEQLHASADGSGHEALIAATGSQTPLQAVSAALEAITDGCGPRLAAASNPDRVECRPPNAPSPPQGVLDWARQSARAAAMSSRSTPEASTSPSVYGGEHGTKERGDPGQGVPPCLSSNPAALDTVRPLTSRNTEVRLGY